ncbi:CENP-B N-terminal DNA-binding domain [Popillia japonica]|uniref:CENP-B N-terminal DNA-binding domain n=1 Tax=Popillia japonica TaxID=7064 RepID=A0AAW1HUA5_POPJA
MKLAISSIISKCLSISAAARDYNIKRTTLQSRIKKLSQKFSLEELQNRMGDSGNESDEERKYSNKYCSQQTFSKLQNRMGDSGNESDEERKYSNKYCSQQTFSIETFSIDEEMELVDYIKHNLQILAPNVGPKFHKSECPMFLRKHKFPTIIFLVGLYSSNNTISRLYLHRKGKMHVVPDDLSRSVPKVDLISIISQHKHKYHLRLLDRVKTHPDGYPLFQIIDGRLCRYGDSSNNFPVDDIDHWKLVVPKEQQRDVIRACHDVCTDLWHFGPTLGAKILLQTRKHSLKMPEIHVTLISIFLATNSISLVIKKPLYRRGNGDSKLEPLTRWYAICKRACSSCKHPLYMYEFLRYCRVTYK